MCVRVQFAAICNGSLRRHIFLLLPVMEGLCHYFLGEGVNKRPSWLGVGTIAITIVGTGDFDRNAGLTLRGGFEAAMPAPIHPKKERTLAGLG